MKDEFFMRSALRLARRGLGSTSPNPMVGAILVRGGKVIGRGWHRKAGFPHAEVEALRDAAKLGNSPKNATLYVTLEPCCTTGRTPPCTKAILAAGISRVVVGAIDPNPRHAGKGLRILRSGGVKVISGVLGEECNLLNAAFNHWIVKRTPCITVKSAMTLDGRIATASGESKWITGEKARAIGMQIRRSVDAVLVGINTVLADDPKLTVRIGGNSMESPRRRIILDSSARTPLKSRVASDEFRQFTTIVVSRKASKRRVIALSKQVRVMVAPASDRGIDLRWLTRELGKEGVTSLLVEGGGEVNASFLLGGFAHRVLFFYAPKILGGRIARKGIAGDGLTTLSHAVRLEDVEWRNVGADLMLTACVA